MENAFCDVILACEDNWNGAHKLVLNLKTHYNPIETAIISDHGNGTCGDMTELPNLIQLQSHKTLNWPMKKKKMCT